MFNDLTKIVFIALSVLLCMMADSSSKISKDFIGEEKKEILAPVEEKKEILDAVEEEEGLTKGGEKASSDVFLPARVIVRGTLGIAGTRFMRNGGKMEISGIGAVTRDPNTVGVKMRHPTAPQKSKIEIISGIGIGSAARLSSEFNGDFDDIARLIIPFLSADLIGEDTLPSGQGWKGIYPVPADDDDGICMFSPSIAAYYNAIYSADPSKTLIFDVSDPILNGSIDPTPSPSYKNFAFRTIVATLDPTDQSLPTYNITVAPCGVDANGVYHVPFGIGCKNPTYVPNGDMKIKASEIAVDVRGSGQVRLEGNNSYILNGIFYVRKGVEAVITTPLSMPQSNINVQPDMSGGTSKLSFVANGTPFAMRSGTTLTVKDGGIVDIPLNATLNLGVASVAMEAGSTMSIDGSVRF